jgi:hypothetical protein
MKKRLVGLFMSMMNYFRKGVHLEFFKKRMRQQMQLEIDDYLQRHLYQNPRYQTGPVLNRYEYQVFSQYGEDGILNEIFNRIGTTNRFFVEFGVEIGHECNTTLLLVQGWSGVWIDGNEGFVKKIRKNFQGVISQGRLKAFHRFISAENIESIFKDAGVPTEFDLLSIDIDRNDYHVWKALHRYKPRVVVIEYNAIYRPGTEFVVPYDADAVGDGTSHFGASLESFTKLAEELGYRLVATSFAGVNAFFVREDLVEPHFTGPFTASHFYHPPRYFLVKKNGHPRRLSL